jgi:hypothetical protein
MVLFVLENGRKGPNDVVVRVFAYGEVFSLAEFLFLAKQIFDSEASCYPVSEGFIGKAMLLNALNELSHGVPFEKVLERYGLKRKGKTVNVVDRRNLEASKPQSTVKPSREVIE